MCFVLFCFVLLNFFSRLLMSKHCRLHGASNYSAQKRSHVSSVKKRALFSLAYIVMLMSDSVTKTCFLISTLSYADPVFHILIGTMPIPCEATNAIPSGVPITVVVSSFSLIWLWHRIFPQERAFCSFFLPFVTPIALYSA